MRIVIGALLLLMSINAAAAQSGPYAAPAPTPAVTTPAAATPAPATPAAATAPVAPAVPAAPLYAPGTADFHVNGASVIAATPPRSPEQQKADEESRGAWQARCRPTVIEDREGIRRTRYAATGCDLSPFNMAGTK